MIRRKRQEEEEEKGGKRKVLPNSSLSFTSRSSSHRLVRVVLFFASFAVVCSKSVRFYFEHFNNSSSSLSLSLSSLPPGNPMIFSKEEGKEEEEEDDDEEKEEDTNNNVFGDLRENDLVETPFKRLRKTTKTTTTISKSILTKMKDLPMMDIFSSSSSSSSSSSNNNNNKKKQYETCALVGTAAIVTDAQRGGEIDANDAVFRTDDAPTKRYEQFVGRRATYRIVSGGGGSRSSSSSSTSSFFEDIVSSGEAVKEKSIVTIGTTMTTTSSSSSMEGESEDESAGGNGDEGEDRKVMKKYTSPFAKYLVALDDVAKEKIREALSLMMMVMMRTTTTEEKKEEEINSRTRSLWTLLSPMPSAKRTPPPVRYSTTSAKTSKSARRHQLAPLLSSSPSPNATASPYTASRLRIPTGWKRSRIGLEKRKPKVGGNRRKLTSLAIECCTPWFVCSL